MAKVRFIAAESRIVPWLGRTVQPDEVVTVPDGQFESYVCQPSVWAAVEDPSTSSTPKRARTRKDGE